MTSLEGRADANEQAVTDAQNLELPLRDELAGHRCRAGYAGAWIASTQRLSYVSSEGTCGLMRVVRT